MGSPDDNAAAALKAQSAGQFRATDRTAKALPELGEGAFAIVLKSGTKMGLFAPKGALRINVEVYGPGRKSMRSTTCAAVRFFLSAAPV